MGLRDLLKKKDKDGDEGGGPAEKQQQQHQGAAGGDDDHLARPPDFKFIRSDTHSAEVIHPPSAPVTPKVTAPGGDSGSISGGEGGGSGRRSFFGGSSSSSSRKRDQSTTTTTTGHLGSGEEKKEKGLRRLSQKLHLTRSSGGTSSENVPQDLPEIVVAPAVGSGDGDGDGDGNEAQWEQRATLLARENERVRSRPGSPDGGGGGDLAGGLGSMEIGDGGGGAAGGSGGRKRSASAVSTKAIDDDIQEAIRLHEAGDLERSTVLFGRLADPQGANNPLSQVLYGLALRHGWGCEPDQAGAVHYLSKAAANAATVETLALQAGMKKGGAAKGELVLAIFELANCFRHGWGVPKDAVAAKQYYETAANLGDTDAMNEVAWCYLEGFGCKKDKNCAPPGPSRPTDDAAAPFSPCHQTRCLPRASSPCHLALCVRGSLSARGRTHWQAHPLTHCRKAKQSKAKQSSSKQPEPRAVCIVQPSPAPRGGRGRRTHGTLPSSTGRGPSLSLALPLPLGWAATRHTTLARPWANRSPPHAVFRHHMRIGSAQS
ncbi:hypothetical protein RB601_007781 [Gaeumannomyces tritici]